MLLRPLLQPDTVWLDQPNARRIAGSALAAILGLAAYGFSVGVWRSPLMGVYVAIKMPLLIACTLACNGLLNGLLGALLGSGLGFRQSWLALLTAFAQAALILGSLSPVTFFLAWNAPPPDSPQAVTAHSAYLIAHTALIAFAGVVSNLHLHRLLAGRAPNRLVANGTLFAWLAGNAFLGAQFSWLLRPFFGSPGLKVQFLRDHSTEGGNFYQAVWTRLEVITGGNAIPAVAALTLLSALFLLPLVLKRTPTRTCHESH
jgi:hypothetical protein